MTAQQFTEKLFAALQNKYPNFHLKLIEDLYIQIFDGDGNEYSAFLSNSYAEYSQNPERINLIIGRYLSALHETITRNSATDIQKRIIPIIKNVGYITDVNISLESSGIDANKINLVYEKYNDTLIILYAEDSPHHMRYLIHDELKVIGINDYELRDLSVNNLKSLLSRIELHGSDGTYVMSSGGDYDASLLLFENIWKGGQIKVNGDYVIAIPSRDVFIITGSNDNDGISNLKRVAKKTITEDSYPLTDQLFIYKNGKFMEFEK